MPPAGARAARGAPLPTRAIVACAVLALVLRLAAAWLIPFAAGAPDPNCAPDEAWHFWVTRDLAMGETPTWPASWSIYSVFPPPQYLAQALTLELSRVGLDHARLYRFPVVEQSARGFPLARLGSVLLGVATAVFLAVAAWLWTGSVGALWVAGTIAAAYPQAIFVSAYVNADAYTMAAGALLVLALARWATAGERATHLPALGLAAGLVLIGKPSGFFLLPATGCWVGWAAARGRLGARHVLRACGAALVVAGPILLWNAIRNGGDPLGVGKFDAFIMGGYARTTPDDFAAPWRTFAVTVLRSAVGVAGNMDRPLPSPLIGVALLLLAVGLVGALVRVMTHAAPKARRFAAWIAVSVAINVALLVHACWHVDFQIAQGRYVLLSMLGLSIVAACVPIATGGTRSARIWSGAYAAFIVAAGLAMELVLWRHPCT